MESLTLVQREVEVFKQALSGRVLKAETKTEIFQALVSRVVVGLKKGEKLSSVQKTGVRVETNNSVELAKVLDKLPVDQVFIPEKVSISLDFQTFVSLQQNGRDL